MPDSASDLADRLADNAEAVCRHYLSNGRRQGRWWTVGDVYNTPGRSMMVRMKNTDRGRAGKWTDAATGEHGDLLDLIARAKGSTTLADTLDEARRFLSLPQPEPYKPTKPAPQGSPEAARRLFAMSGPIRGTVAEAYLRTRGQPSAIDCVRKRKRPGTVRCSCRCANGRQTSQPARKRPSRLPRPCPTRSRRCPGPQRARDLMRLPRRTGRTRSRHFLTPPPTPRYMVRVGCRRPPRRFR